MLGAAQHRNEVKTPSAEEKPKPNIVMFIVDDMGYNQVGYHAKIDHGDGINTEIQTPTIDKLALKGLELKRAYVTPWCAPSRTALQTGRLDNFNQLVPNNVWNYDPATNFTGGIQVGTATIAQKLKKEGYATHFHGKFGIGGGAFLNTPAGMGYDSFYGFYGDSIESCDGWEPAFTGAIGTPLANSMPGYWHQDLSATANSSQCEVLMASTILDDQEKLIGCKTFPRAPPSLIDLDLLTQSEQVIEDHDFDRSPLLLVHAMQLLHLPMEYPEQYKIAADKLKAAGVDNFEKQDLTATAPPENDDMRGGTNNAVRFVDDVLGGLVAKLKAEGQWDNTIMLFTSDNGGAIYSATQNNNYPLRGAKFNLFEGAIRVVQFLSGGFVEKQLETWEESKQATGTDLSYDAERGWSTDTYMFVHDWPVTLLEMAGFDDPEAMSCAGHDADGAGASTPTPGSHTAGRAMWAGYLSAGRQLSRKVAYSDEFFLDVRESGSVYKNYYVGDKNVMFDYHWTPTYPKQGDFVPDMGYLGFRPCGNQACCKFDVAADPFERNFLPMTAADCAAMKKEAEALWNMPYCEPGAPRTCGCRDERIDWKGPVPATPPAAVGFWTQMGGAAAFLSKDARPVAAPLRCPCNMIKDGIAPAEVRSFIPSLFGPNVCTDDEPKLVMGGPAGRTPLPGSSFACRGFVRNPIPMSATAPVWKSVGVDMGEIGISFADADWLARLLKKEKGNIWSPLNRAMAAYNNREGFYTLPNIAKFPYVTGISDTCQQKRVVSVPVPHTQMTPWIFSSALANNPTLPQSNDPNVCVPWNTTFSWCPYYQGMRVAGAGAADTKTNWGAFVKEWIHDENPRGVFANGSVWLPIPKDQCNSLCPK